MDEELMTTQEIGDYLRVSRMCIYNWRKEGMPYIGEKGFLRYKKKEVEDWLKNRGGKKSHANRT